jgi:adenine-specific DNA-methyltransferase
MNETTLNGQSADIVSENIQKLKQIFPEVFCEDSVDFDKLQAVLGEYIDDDNERYNFTWWGKSRALRLAQTPSMGTLRPCVEESKDWDTTENLYIEGDNLEVLKLLQKSYHGKVKMIYIDPPYNTGKDFVYPDNYKDPLRNYLEMTKQVNIEGNKNSTNSEANGRYHTNWLNMMYPRLRLARNFLSDDGVIFISIDDSEVENTRKLCNEIFGEENFIGIITVLCNPKGRSQDKYLATCHEYLAIYSKTVLLKGALSIPKTDEDLLADYPREDNYGLYRELELRNTHREFGKHNRPNLFYPFYVDNDYTVWLDDSPNRQTIYPVWGDGFEGCWTWGVEKAKEDLSLLVARTVGESIKIYRKDYAVKNGVRTQKQLKSIWSNKKYHTEKGQDVFNLLFDVKGKIFQSPKSLDLLIDSIMMSEEDGENDNYVMDFFSGSSTAAHAVMKLNAEDGGKRKFIMVQLPEATDEKSEAYKAGYENICEIGKERIRRAGEKIKADLIEKNNGKLPLDGETQVDPEALDIGFKVFKLDNSNLKKWNPDHANLEQTLLDSIDNFVEDRSALDVVYEIMLKYGIDLTYPIEVFETEGKKIYCVGFGALMICLDNEITIEVAQEIARLKEEINPEVMRVVFKDNGFRDDSVKTNTKEILRNAGIDEIVSV